jgi:hypothetical protein
VADVWNKETKGGTPLQQWQHKIQRIKQFLRGCARNTSGNYRKEKANLIKKTEELDIKAETQVLSCSEFDLKHCLKEHLA